MSSAARSRRVRSLALPLAGVIALAALGGPVAVLIARTFGDGTVLAAVADPVVIDALRLSLASSSVSVVVVVVFGTPLAYLLARRSFRGKALAEGIVDLPIILPPSVAGLALLLTFGRRGTLGPALEFAGITIPFTTLAVIVAQTFVAAPFFVRVARAGFRAIDRDLEDAARVDGASEIGVFRHVTVPLSKAALGAGVVLAWARALGEFGATILFAGNIVGRTQTLPLLVYSEFQVSLGSSIAAAAVLVLAASAVLVAARMTRWPEAFDVRP